MKAMIFAAGLGTRLRPLTLDRPKALVTVAGRTLLEWNILYLRAAGYDEIVVNIHHFGQQIIDFLRAAAFKGLQFHLSDEREQLLDTGGGLWQAREWLDGDEPFLLCNADILTDLDLAAFRQSHLKRQALVSLAVRQRESSRYLLFDGKDQLCGWQHAQSGALRMARPGQSQLHPYAFSGLHYISPALFPLIRERGKFSIIDLYLRVAAEQDILAYEHSASHWLDVGKPDRLARADDLLAQMDWSRQVQDSGQD